MPFRAICTITSEVVHTKWTNADQTFSQICCMVDQDLTPINEALHSEGASN